MEMSLFLKSYLNTLFCLIKDVWRYVTHHKEEHKQNSDYLSFGFPRNGLFHGLIYEIEGSLSSPYRAVVHIQVLTDVESFSLGLQAVFI